MNDIVEPSSIRPLKTSNLPLTFTRTGIIRRMLFLVLKLGYALRTGSFSLETSHESTLREGVFSGEESTVPPFLPLKNEQSLGVHFESLHVGSFQEFPWIGFCSICGSLWLPMSFQLPHKSSHDVLYFGKLSISFLRCIWKSCVQLQYRCSNHFESRAITFSDQETRMQTLYNWHNCVFHQSTDHTFLRQDNLL